MNARFNSNYRGARINGIYHRPMDNAIVVMNQL